MTAAEIPRVQGNRLRTQEQPDVQEEDGREDADPSGQRHKGPDQAGRREEFVRSDPDGPDPRPAPLPQPGIETREETVKQEQDEDQHDGRRDP